MSAAELHAEALHEDGLDGLDTDEGSHGLSDTSHQVSDTSHRLADSLNDESTPSGPDNRWTLDDATRQTLTNAEIESLKLGDSGKAIIAKIKASHRALDEKTAFSLAKYTLRKSQKFLRRFTVLPLDVACFTRWILAEKEALRVLELRDEVLALIATWANVHYCGESEETISTAPSTQGRWLVIDDTGGLVVATLAERMGILYSGAETARTRTRKRDRSADEDDHVPVTCPDDSQDDQEMSNNDEINDQTGPNSTSNPIPSPDTSHTHDSQARPNQELAHSNTLTLLHANAQPNLGLLRYFGFDTNDPPPSHPLYRHLRTLSWLQLLHPTEDVAYAEPEQVPDAVVRAWKSSKRGIHHRKRRRWERVRRVVDETRAGGFDGLVVASTMDAVSVLQRTIPLLRPGAQVVVYSPVVEPLSELADLYAKGRKTAFMSAQAAGQALPDDDFPLDPTLLLAPTIHTCRLRSWQVLPGRTHPLMNSKGGAEGYIFTGTRVLTPDASLQMRPAFMKRRRV